jgi:hypothetical protein
MMRTPNLHLLVLVGGVVAAMLLPPAGRATGGRYAFAGGTPRQHAEVERALEVGGFDWSAVPAPITIHIDRGLTSSAKPGHIWLDGDLLDAGTFAWGIVQHEYAHQVDFFLLDAQDRSLLLRELGGTAWCSETPVRRDLLGCERFASALAWAYWPSPDNCMHLADASFRSREFRRLVSRLIGER